MVVNIHKHAHLNTVFACDLSSDVSPWPQLLVPLNACISWCISTNAVSQSGLIVHPHHAKMSDNVSE